MLVAECGSPTYLQFREVLLRYISRISVDAMLRQACARAQISPMKMQQDDQERLIEQVSPAMRLFCTPANLPKLMLDLAELMM